MNLVLSDEIIAALLAIAAAFVGYAFREYRTRIRPFFQITEIDGGIRRNSDTAEVPAATREQARHSAFTRIREFTESATPDLRSVFRAWDYSDDITRVWPVVRPEIERFLRAPDDDVRMSALAELASLTHFDRWLMSLLSSGRLTVPSVNTSGPPRVVVADSEDREGCVWLSFDLPGQTWQFGSSLKLPVMRSKVQPLIDAIRYFDVPVLAAALRSFQQILDQEHAMASAVGAALKTILDANSRWSFEVYLGNLSPYPIVVDTSAQLVVRDAHGTTFSEPCYLVKITYDQDGMDRTLRDTRTPIVVRSGEDAVFGLITVNRQRDMQRGMAIRETFDGGGGVCSLQVTVEKVGLLRRQRFASRYVPFAAKGVVTG